MSVEHGLDARGVRERDHGGAHQDDQELQQKLRRVLQDVVNLPGHEEQLLQTALVVDDYLSDLEQLEFFLNVGFRVKSSLIA